MHTTVKSPARKVAAARRDREAPKQYLRAWLATLEDAGELTMIHGDESE